MGIMGAKGGPHDADPHPLLLMMGLVSGVGVLVGPAHAYIDPGTGIYILQVAIAFLVGLAFSIKFFWKRIDIFFRKAVSGKKRSTRMLREGAMPSSCRDPAGFIFRRDGVLYRAVPR